MESSSRLDAATLADVIRECCAGVGLAPADAQAVSDVLVYASLRGQDGHGFVRTGNYMLRVDGGLAGGSDRLTTVAATPVTRRIDARRTIGPAAATHAMDQAAEIAQANGIGLVGLQNATHFGAAGYYARRAAAKGLIAIVLSNAPKSVAPHGAAEPLLGTNPLAVGIPAGRQGEVVLDMATSALARGQVRHAAESGDVLPPGAAVDAQGRPTTDAHAALAGSLLPFGGAKGSGLALVVSLLAVSLTGADLDDEMGSMQPGTVNPSRFPLFGGSVGQVFVAIDAGPLTGSASEERVAAFVDRLRGLPPLAGFDSVRSPGERGDAIAAERLQLGIPVPRADLAEVATVCAHLGLDDTARRVERLAAA